MRGGGLQSIPRGNGDLPSWRCLGLGGAMPELEGLAGANAEYDDEGVGEIGGESKR